MKTKKVIAVIVLVTILLAGSAWMISQSPKDFLIVLGLACASAIAALAILTLVRQD